MSALLRAGQRERDERFASLLVYAVVLRSAARGARGRAAVTTII